MSIANKLIAVSGSSGYEHWVSFLDTPDHERYYNIFTSTTGDIYTGYANLTAGRYYVVKQSPRGDTLWVKSYDYINIRAMGCCDPYGNVYIVGPSTSANNRVIVMKTNSEGDFLWAKELAFYNILAAPIIGGVGADADGNIYAVGTFGVVSTSKTAVAFKLNSQGVFQLAKSIAHNTNSSTCALAVRGDTFVIGGNNVNDAGKRYRSKFDTTGNTIWAASDDHNPLAILFYDFAIDSNENVFGADKAWLTKYAPNGDLLWSYRYNTSSTSVMSKVCVDSSDNVFISDEYKIIKCDNDGNVIWANTTNLPISDMKVDDEDSVIISGNTFFDSYGIWSAKLPGDGSGVGTYDSFTYSSSTATPTPQTLTVGSTVTTNISTYSDSTASITAQVEDVPIDVIQVI